MNFITRLFKETEDVEEQTHIDLYGTAPKHIDYPDCSMSELIYEAVKKYPKYDAVSYYGKTLSYQKFYEQIEIAAKALKVIGVKPKDAVTICMPNTPEAITLFYAINMIGAVANMIHPLSSENEIEFYLDVASSKYILTLNMFAQKVISAANKCNAEKIILSDVTDGMFYAVKKVVATYKTISKFIKPEAEEEFEFKDKIISWNTFFDLGYGYEGEYKFKSKGSDKAVHLYSGGTTGRPKGVMLSNLNFNALGMQCFQMTDPAKAGDSALAILPIFHGFGLAANIHTLLISGMKVVLIPKFEPKDFAKLIKKYHPVFLVGVPTMYDLLTKIELNSKYLKSVTSCICGGDLLAPKLRQTVNEYLKAHGSDAQIRVGYGLTESTAACCLTPRYYFKEGGIGLPLPDTEIKIVKPGTTKEVKHNRQGEICVNGPTVMLGYLNEEEETTNTLKIHADGKTWLHTGDVGYKDKDGFVFFSSRIKRIIVSSGYNIYPQYLEKIIDSHPAVLGCVVVGIPHISKQQVPVACIVLKDNFAPSDVLTKDIKSYCAQSIAKYAMPYKYEYIKTIPKTLIGKVNFKKLEEECTKKYAKKQ